MKRTVRPWYSDAVTKDNTYLVSASGQVSVPAAFRRTGPVGRLTAPWPTLPELSKARLRRALLALPREIDLISLRELAWPAAELQAIHGEAGRPLSAVMAEALAAAHHLGAGIAVSRNDVGPNLAAAAEADGIAFHAL